MRADQIRPGYRASGGATVIKVATTYDPEDANEGITTFWWDDGQVTYTAPWHQVGGSGSPRVRTLRCTLCGKPDDDHDPSPCYGGGWVHENGRNTTPPNA